ncbi:AAA family ATPase [Bradyrhizobium sp. SZCCHNPS2010]|uniref:AAA family ATPase n=1 Tax=Bradyrhizobium sp. SZCCHNPS2010 TaxID=3057333 RepID=UPI0029165F54|nr:AAA family ATPase [Bradyrhizobium sp. SZCCHNPS2010]
MAAFPKLETSFHSNDNLLRRTEPVPGSSFKRFGPGHFETADYLIKGILPLYGVALLAGQYSSGKTFVALDLALSLIHGVSFLGRNTKPGAVLWLAAEGAGILEQRLEAARLAKFKADINAPQFPFLWTEPDPAKDTDAVLADLSIKIREAKNECETQHPGHPLRLVVIDTLAAYFALKDENDNAEVGGFMARLGKIARDMQTLVMPIHHMGKSADGGIRGASAFGAGADAALAVLASINPQTGEVDGPRTISLAKTRNGNPGPLTSFTIGQVVIGIDNDGDGIAPGYVAYTPVGASKGKQPSRAVCNMMDSINEAMQKHGKELQVFEDAPPRKAVRIDHVRDEFMRRHAVGDSVDTSTKRQAYRRALEKVLNSKTYCSRIVAGVEYIWPIQV